MTTTITRLYDTRAHAEDAVRALKAAGIGDSDISMVASQSDYGNPNHVADKINTDGAGNDAGAGAGIGGVLGGGAGLLAGLGLLAIPGLGPVVAAGWLAATATGAVAGAVAGGATGGIVGAMTDAGVDHNTANVYAESVRRGSSLVTARVPDDRRMEAERMLDQYHPVSAEVRGSEFRNEGWANFDPDAVSYTDRRI